MEEHVEHVESQFLYHDMEVPAKLVTILKYIEELYWQVPSAKYNSDEFVLVTQATSLNVLTSKYNLALSKPQYFELRLSVQLFFEE